jgi:hypothetical protein
LIPAYHFIDPPPFDVIQLLEQVFARAATCAIRIKPGWIN